MKTCPTKVSTIVLLNLVVIVSPSEMGGVAMGNFVKSFNTRSCLGKKIESIESSLDPISRFLEGLNVVFESCILPELDTREFNSTFPTFLYFNRFRAI